VREKLQKAGLKAEVAEVTMKPTAETQLTGDEGAKMRKLIDALETLDDVQEVYTSAVMDESGAA
jgi:transcriptional/translational regulatory protein YebC/TACO1